MGVWSALGSLLNCGSWDEDRKASGRVTGLAPHYKHGSLLVFWRTVGGSSGVHIMYLEWTLTGRLNSLRDKWSHAGVGECIHCPPRGLSGMGNAA